MCHSTEWPIETALTPLFFLPDLLNFSFVARIIYDCADLNNSIPISNIHDEIQCYLNESMFDYIYFLRIKNALIWLCYCFFFSRFSVINGFECFTFGLNWFSKWVGSSFLYNLFNVKAIYFRFKRYDSISTVWLIDFLLYIRRRSECKLNYGHYK